MSHDDSRGVYGKASVNQFIRGLGCWASDNFGRAMAQRIDQEYIKDLKKLIEVNKSRHDGIAAMETAEAWAVLGRLQGVTK